MVTVVGQNSVWQKTYTLPRFRRNAVNRMTGVFESAAGKGSNLARCLTDFGIRTVLLAYAGGANGRKFTQACTEEDGLNCQFVAISGETRTCTTLLEDGKNMVTELVEPAPEITAGERESYAVRLKELLAGTRFLAIAGTAVQGESPDCYYRFVQDAHAHGASVLLDSYTEHGRKALEAGPEVLKINIDECEALVGRKLRTLSARAKTYADLRNRYGIRWIVITKGKDGIEGCNGNGLYTVRSAPISSVNPIGSGDAASGGLLYGIHQQTKAASAPEWDDDTLLIEAMKMATAFGAANCMNNKPGSINKDDFENVRRNLSVGRN